MAHSVTEQEAFEWCASRVFARKLAEHSPYESVDDLLATAKRIWWEEVPASEWLSAFDAHPKIGDVNALKKKDGDEQSAALDSLEQHTIEELAEWNAKYREKFGHVFLVYALGKTAAEILRAVKIRYASAPCNELIVCAGEETKITEKRVLEKFGRNPSDDPCAMFFKVPSEGDSNAGLRSPITTHVLDTCRGVPGRGISVALQRKVGPGYLTAAEGVTNADGRVGDLLSPGNFISAGVYRMTFHTGKYLEKCKEEFKDFYAEVPFYPEAHIDFEIAPEQVNQHFHIPLLLSPYGYTTYRGS